MAIPLAIVSVAGSPESWLPPEPTASSALSAEYPAVPMNLTIPVPASVWLAWK